MTAGRGRAPRVAATSSPRQATEPDDGRAVPHQHPDRGGGRAQREHVVLPPQPESVPAGRHFLRLQLRIWGLDAVSEAVELAASELITNAVLHARTAFELTLEAEQDVLVSVRDLSTSHPRTLAAKAEDGAQPADPDSEGGRGLALVEAVTAAWGTHTDRHGTTVWFRVPLPHQ